MRIYLFSISLSVCFILALLIPVWLWGNDRVFLTFNQSLTPYFGKMAIIFSWYGEFWGILFLLIFSTFKNRRKGILVGLGWLIGACYSWLFKLGFLNGKLRPFPAFQKMGVKLNTVPGVEIHSYNTFPSGHTLTAFSILILSIVAFPKMPKIYQSFLFLLAVLCGLSRIILVQHWPLDVAGGAFLGVLTGYSVWKISFLFPQLKNF
jgi:membrane-associated phospholipid phosphatase